MYKKLRLLAVILLLVIFSNLFTNETAAAAHVPTQAEIQQKLDTLASMPRPYLVMSQGDVQQHLNCITQRDFTFVGEPNRTKIDADYLNTLKNSGFGPIYSYFTGLDKQAENDDFWAVYYDKKANRATVRAAEQYKGAAMREVWRWLIGYHFVQDFGYATDEQKTDLYNYTTQLVDILYNAKAKNTDIPEILESIGLDFSNYRNHNYHAEVVGVLFYYALVFPEAPNAAKYFQYAMEEFEYLMANAVYDGGAWNECPRYAGAIFRTWVPLFYDIKRLLGYDLFANAEFKSLLDYFVKSQTPASLEKETGLTGGKKGYYAGRSPGLADSIWTTDWYIYCAMAAPAYLQSDPEFAGNLMYAWKEAGSPFISHMKKEAFTVTDINADITPIAPSPSSLILSQEKGNVILNSDIDGENEKWLLFRSGKGALTNMPLSSHQHSDQNSFSLFAFGHPIVLDPGINDYGAGDEAFLRSTPSHNTVDYVKFVNPNPIYKQLWGEQQTQHTTTKGEIGKFVTNENYDLVVGKAAKKGWREVLGIPSPVETQTYNFNRSIFFAKPDYYIIKDHIANNTEATFHLNVLSETNIDIDGYEATFDHPEEDIMLKVIFLNHNGITFETTTIPLAKVPEWGNELKALKANHSSPEEDGFVTLLYPYRKGSPEIYASYDDTLREIQVIKGTKRDMITFDASGKNWNIVGTTLPQNFEIGRLYTEQTLSGGPHGTPYNDYNVLHGMYVDGEALRPGQIKVRAGDRIDALEFCYDNGTCIKHGGNGGTEYIITQNDGVFIKKITAYNGKKDNQTRVFGLKFHYSDGTESQVYGTQTSDITELGDPQGRGYIVGMHGRSGTELDRLGVIVFIPAE